jgi:hypothetical protein
LVEAFGGGANGFDSTLGGGPNGLSDRAADWALEPEAAEFEPDEAEFEPDEAGSQLARLAFEPRSASSQ